MKDVHVISVSPENISQYGVYCIKNDKHPGAKKKRAWFEQRYKEGLRLKILLRKGSDQQCGFIEYTPAEYAWRPVEADGYLFIHCLFTYPSKNQQKGYGALLIRECIKDAQKLNKSGVAVMTSSGSWITDDRVFRKEGFEVVDRRGRFELMAVKMVESAPNPRLIDWESKQKTYHGWQLIYADQCPMHEKSANDLAEMCRQNAIELKVTKLSSARQAKNAPSGFGVYSLLYNGRLLADHYVSKGRFKNILKKEIGLAVNRE